MTAYKAKVKAVYPAAYCWPCGVGCWRIYHKHQKIGKGKTAFLAWVDAWRNIEAKNNQK
jgi:hypothetical protein